MTIAPEGRKLLRLEVRNASTPIEKKPSWIKTTARFGPEYRALSALVKDEGLHTVCQEAGCPNIFECWEDREATFLIGGDQCTRRCDFCQIDTGKPADFDAGEPLRVAESVRTMQLRYATVTGVCRDDLPDEGAWLYARDHPPDPRAEPRHRGGDAGPRLLRKPRLPGPVVRRRSGGLRAQHRDGAPDLPPDPARVPLRPVAGGATRLAGRRAGHQVQPDSRHGRDPRRDHRRRCGTCTTRAPRSSPSPSTCGRRSGTTRWNAGCTRRSSSSSRPRRRRWASPAYSADRWSAPPTGPAGSTGRPWPTVTRLADELVQKVTGDG